LPSDNHDLVHIDHNTPGPWSAARTYAHEPLTWVLVTGALIGVGIVIAVAYTVLWLLATILTGIFEMVQWIGHSLAAFAEPSAHTLTDPIRRYIESHADHLPVSADAIWWAWVTITVALFILATIGSRGARIGWTVIGLTTVALAWMAATPPDQVVSAAIVAAAWAALSVIAFNGIALQPEPLVIEFRLDPTQAADTK
jgi:O-antigen ligase